MTMTTMNGDAAGPRRHGGSTVKIRVGGELDALGTPGFRRQLDTLAQRREIGRLVLDLSTVRYLSSAGLRSLLYLRQRFPEPVSIALAGVQEPVGRTLRLAGFQRGLELTDHDGEAAA
ncbi:hypothetical protein GCM10020229_30140 [Kitasatospora albolonga]|uniref:STAS domain-containing protein n=2 Tax=Kitasatospora albolonga TaxID=68173 RepID=UPI0031F1A0DD